jgi:ribosomal protein S18 acetylase RimI-like enzyme
VEDTAKRFSLGQGLLALVGSRVIGTITVRPPQPDAKVTLYRDPHTWSIGQYAVLPEFRGQGVGRRLHDAAVAHAVAAGGLTMALDTAQPATALVAMYETWGYRVVGEADFRPKTNYLSVLMTRGL